MDEEERIRLADERLALECDKLREEIAKLRAPVKFSEKLPQYSTAVSTLIAVLVFLLGLGQYTKEQSKNREAAARQTKAEVEARDRTFMYPLWERQLALYFEASQAAATIATTTDSQERERAKNKFWMLYEGPLIVVESPSVSGAMKAFGECLEQQSGDLRDLSRQLSSAIQKSIEEGANIRLSEFSKGKFDYRR